MFHVSDPETRAGDGLLQAFSSGDPGAVLSLEMGGSDALSRDLCVLGLFCCRHPWPQVLRVYVGRGGPMKPCAPLPTREILHIFKNDSRCQKGNRINLKCEVFQVDARGVSEQ